MRNPDAPAEMGERIQAVDSRLREINPRWGRLFKVDLGHWWLCAPNAFRLLEYDLWAIGHDRQALDGWWRGGPAAGPVADDVNRRLGESTPVKRWLVRLYLKKLHMLASYEGEGLSKMVGVR